MNEIRVPEDTNLLPQPQQCQTQTLSQLKQFHARILKLPFLEFPAAVTSLLTFAATSTRPAFLSYARVVFQNLGRRTTFLYNIMIRGYVQKNRPIEAILYYRDMAKEGLIRNNYTFTPLVKACSMMVPQLPHMGLSVHAQVVRLGFSKDLFITSALIQFYASNLDMKTAEEMFVEIPVRDVVLWTCMIDGYGRIEDVGKARELFDEIPERNVVCWSAIMAAYSRICNYREVLWLYRRMERSGLVPNEAVLVIALTACAHLGALAQGLWIHSYAEKMKYISNAILATALVDMYAKCGCVKLAFRVFEEIHDKDSGAWNAIIAGMAMNGNSNKSLELFADMVSFGMTPTPATFVAVITACTHAKLVDKGLDLFKDMSSVYNIEPSVEHYACVIDLLARSGKLEEAENLVDEKMRRSGEQDVNLWGALLAACRIHGKVDIGNRLWRKMTNKGVGDYGIHVLAYNMYREAGWDAEARSVRRLIHKKQVKKTPGCSAIEVNGVVEEFVAGEFLHPKADEMCKILDSLVWDASFDKTICEHNKISEI